MQSSGTCVIRRPRSAKVESSGSVAYASRNTGYECKMFACTMTSSRQPFMFLELWRSRIRIAGSWR